MNLKLLIIVVISVQLFSILFGLILVFVGDKRCMTKNCVKLASIINNYVNSEINPCDDFYKFACGKMLEGNKSNKLLSEASKSINEKIIHVLEGNPESGEPEAFNLGREYFKQCQHQESESKMKANIIGLINRVGGYPTLDGDTWSEANWTLVGALERLRNAGLYTEVFFSLNLRPGFFDTSQYIPSISIQKPNLLYRPQTLAICESHCQEDLSHVYSSLMTSIGIKPDDADKDAKEMLQLDIQIAKLTYQWIPKLPHDYTLNDTITTIDQFTLKFNFFDWKKYFSFMFGREMSTKKFGSSLIMIESKEYLFKIKSIIENTPKKQLAKYVIWYNLMQLMYFPGETYDKNTCLIYMTQTFPEMLNAMAARLRDESGYGVVEKMIDSIKKELINEIHLAGWLDDNTKKVALSKVEHMVDIIGYLKIFVDNEVINNYFGNFKIGDNYLQSYENILKDRTKKEAYCLVTYLTKDAIDDKNVCNLMEYGSLKTYFPKAYYDVMENQIVIPSSILVEPLFDSAWPKYINYGRLGVILGHKLIHSLDVSGSHYDDLGKHTYWWDNLTFSQYEEKAECFENQFSKFKFFNGKSNAYLPAKRYVREDIADNGGLEISFRTYQNIKPWFSDLLLPGVDYNQNQLFFISLAHLYCKKYTDTEYAIDFYDVHPPNPIRVQVSMQNSREFSESFTCSAGSQMNPKKKCSLW